MAHQSNMPSPLCPMEGAVLADPVVQYETTSFNGSGSKDEKFSQFAL